MRGWRIWKLRPMMSAGLACAGALLAPVAAAQGGSQSDVCSLATSVEFQQAYGVDPRIGILPDDPTPTDVVWGTHCDYADGSIDLFATKSPAAELERLLTLMEAVKQRVPVPGLGQRAFFTVIYPDDEYRRRGFLAIHVGSRIVSLSMDDHPPDPIEASRPKLERLAKLVLPRLK